MDGSGLWALGRDLDRLALVQIIVGIRIEELALMNLIISSLGSTVWAWSEEAVSRNGSGVRTRELQPTDGGIGARMNSSQKRELSPPASPRPEKQN
jgi:hypothetical protein